MLDTLDARDSETKAFDLLRDIRDFLRPAKKAAPPSFGHFMLAVKDACAGSHEADRWLEGIGSVKAALSEGSGPTGGYLIPAQFDTAIANVAAPISIVRPRATTFEMTSRSLLLPYLDQESTPAAGTSALIGNVVLTWTAGGAALTESEPKWRMVQLTARKLTGYWISSIELDQDSQPTMDVIGPQLMGRAVAWFEDDAFLAGSGTNQPLGVLNSPATISVTRNTSGSFTAVDEFAMLSKAHPNSINAGSLVWMVHPTVLPKIGAMAYYQPVEALRLAGLPIKVSEHCSVLGTAGDVMLCDFSHYLIGDRTNTAVTISPHPQFTTGQDVIKLVHRVDGQPWLSAPITLKDGTNTVSAFIKLA